MKFYATVKSERASKGQGGNDYLIIDITREIVKGTHSNLARLVIEEDGKIYFPYNGNITEVSTWSQDNPQFFQPETKGKKQ